MYGFRPLMSRACALSPRRDREWCARPTEGECGRAKKNKQAALERRQARQAQFTFTSQDHILERKFHALSGRVTVGRRPTISTGADKKGEFSPFSTVPAARLQGIRRLVGENGDVAVIFCTSFLCLKMAARPLWLEQQVPWQQEFTLNSNPPAL